MAHQAATEPARARRLAALAAAEEGWARARRDLLAAEAIYAQARLAFERARAARAPVAPDPTFLFTCGHLGASPVWDQGGLRLFLCPACLRQERRGALPFAQLQALMVPAPQ